jgi:hypothetical protein
MTGIVKQIRDRYPQSHITIQSDCFQVFINNPDINFATKSVQNTEDYDIIFDLDLAYEKEAQSHIIDAYSKVCKVPSNRKTYLYPLELDDDEESGFEPDELTPDELEKRDQQMKSWNPQKTTFSGKPKPPKKPKKGNPATDSDVPPVSTPDSGERPVKGKKEIRPIDSFGEPPPDPSVKKGPGAPTKPLNVKIGKAKVNSLLDLSKELKKVPDVVQRAVDQGYLSPVEGKPGKFRVLKEGEGLDGLMKEMNGESGEMKLSSACPSDIVEKLKNLGYVS